MTHTHDTTKTPPTSSHLPAHSTWARPAPAFEAEYDDLDALDIETQVANADRLGHHAGRLTVQAKRLAEPPVIQRADLDEEEEEEEETVQRAGGGEGFTLDETTASRINRARDGGQPLPDDVQRQMSAGMGYDFSGVRVHTGVEAHDLNEQLYARAFTTGQDIFFRQGEYNPGSSGGQQVLAHELAHVVQQGTGRVSGNGSGMTVRPAGDAFEREADTVAQRFPVARAYDQTSRSIPVLGHQVLQRKIQSITHQVMGFKKETFTRGVHIQWKIVCDDPRRVQLKRRVKAMKVYPKANYFRVTTGKLKNKYDAENIGVTEIENQENMYGEEIKALPIFTQAAEQDDGPKEHAWGNRGVIRGPKEVNGFVAGENEIVVNDYPSIGYIPNTKQTLHLKFTMGAVELNEHGAQIQSVNHDGPFVFCDLDNEVYI